MVDRPRIGNDCVAKERLLPEHFSIASLELVGGGSMREHRPSVLSPATGARERFRVGGSTDAGHVDDGRRLIIPGRLVAGYQCRHPDEAKAQTHTVAELECHSWKDGSG